jgi:hypothetical protein
VVQSFGNTIVLGGVMDGKLLHGASCFQVHSEGLAKVLTTMVRVQGLDLSAMLGLAPGLKVLQVVGLECVTLLTQEVKVCESSLKNGSWRCLCQCALRHMDYHICPKFNYTDNHLFLL